MKVIYFIIGVFSLAIAAGIITGWEGEEDVQVIEDEVLKKVSNETFKTEGPIIPNDTYHSVQALNDSFVNVVRNESVEVLEGKQFTTESVNTETPIVQNDTVQSVDTHDDITELAPTEAAESVPLDQPNGEISKGPEQAETSKFDWKTWYEESNKKVTIVKLDGSGLGSQMMFLIANKIYAVNVMGRKFAADTTQYYMQYDDEFGVLGGWFQPKYPLIQNKRDMEEAANVFPQYAWYKEQAMNPSERRLMTTSGSSHNESYSLRNLKSPGKMRHRPDFTDFWANKEESYVTGVTKPGELREAFIKQFGRGSEVFPLYAQEACSDFMFSERALTQFADLKAKNQIPDFSKSTNSVAFHVRRGDKLRKESQLYPGTVYVEKLLSILPPDSSSLIQQCFVATDDYGAVEEIRQALQAHGVGCTLTTLTQENEGGHKMLGSNQYNEVLEFLAEVSMLIDATYFVGTYNSNVGGLVSVMRSCVHPQAPHYHHSYGVDRKDWYPR